MTPEQEKLRELMRRYNLRPKQFAEQVGISVHTLRNWLRPVKNRAYRKVSNDKIRTLQLRLALFYRPKRNNDE